MPGLLTEQPIDNRQSSIVNPQHDRAIIALLTQPSIAEAARSCGLGESTLRRWLHQPDFAHAYAQARQQAFSVALGYLQHLSEQAAQTLQSLMQDSQVSPSVRHSAARTVLQMSFKGSELLTLQTRLDQLETAATALEEEQEEDSHLQPQSKIENPIGSDSSNKNHKSKIENRTWWHKLGQAFRSDAEKEEVAGSNRSKPLKSSHDNLNSPTPATVGQANKPDLNLEKRDLRKSQHDIDAAHNANSQVSSLKSQVSSGQAAAAHRKDRERGPEAKVGALERSKSLYPAPLADNSFPLLPNSEGRGSELLPPNLGGRGGEGLGEGAIQTVYDPCAYDPLGEARRAFLAYHRIPFGMRRIDDSKNT